MLITLLALFNAQAGFTVEGPSFEARAPAAEFAKKAKNNGHKGRVVKRYKDGEGWEFVVRFEDLEEEAARDLGTVLSTEFDTPTYLFDDGGRQIAVLQKPIPAEKLAAPDAEEPDWMEKISERHGPGRAVLSEAERVHVVFRRSLPDGRVAQHIYARQGTDLYLGIKKVEGDVVPSETIALAEKAWLVTEKGTTVQDLQRARETIARFGPLALIPLVLDLDGLAAEHPELRTLKAKGIASVAGQPCLVYATEGKTMLAIGEDGLIRRVAIDGDRRVIEFEDYTPVGDTQVPRQVRILVEGVLQSTISIESIELDGDLDKAWLQPRD